ncbi:MAG: hydrogenase maturation nickel metallochaperone HypA [Nitrospina sp.]|jgi:hydrogenase nickel incorporation protein HypA/HybF|nr:hydrogenase maturation nickel metallochaperone HypA [Nitrospina sp.]MBT5633098.1 hydrogenase maturation nickel metallochaperone HypA [Nitrospina sp.]
MHEQSLMADLMRKINAIGQEQKAERVVRVKVKLGALSHISAEHFREHFIQAVQGSCAEQAQLDVEVLTDLNDPQAQDILLESVEIEE